jgi:hypothetical protein
MMQLRFINEATNIVLVGPNGVGKSMIARNFAHQALLHRHSALFVNAAHMLGDLAAQDGDNALRRRFAHYARPEVLVIDETGDLSYGTRHADLLFEIINRRYERKSTIITTNRPFAEWGDVFSGASHKTPTALRHPDRAPREDDRMNDDLLTTRTPRPGLRSEPKHSTRHKRLPGRCTSTSTLDIEPRQIAAVLHRQ